MPRHAVRHCNRLALDWLDQRGNTKAGDIILLGNVLWRSIFHISQSSHQQLATSATNNMAFVVRRPFTLTSAIKQLPRTSKPVIRPFHNAPKPSPLLSLSKSQNAFKPTISRLASQRSYSSPAVPSPNGTLGQRLLYGAAIVGGAIVVTNAVFNRETREDGGMPPFERSYLNETFMHTGLGIGTIGVAANALHRSGWSYRLMAMNPWVVVGGGLVLSIGSMIATRSIDPDK